MCLADPSSLFSVGGHISRYQQQHWQKSMPWSCNVGNNNDEEEKVSFFCFGCIEVLIWSPAVYSNAALYRINWKKSLSCSKQVDGLLYRLLDQKCGFNSSILLLLLSQSCAWIPFVVRKKNRQTNQTRHKTQSTKGRSTCSPRCFFS